MVEEQIPEIWEESECANPKNFPPVCPSLLPLATALDEIYEGICRTMRCDFFIFLVTLYSFF